MITLQRSTDYVAIRAVLTEKRVYRRMANDEAPLSSEFPVELPKDDLQYVVARDPEGIAAVFVICGYGQAVAEVHFCFHPRKWGETIDIARAFIEWLWKETPTKIAVGPVPAYNPLARRLANLAGFEEYGRESASVRKNGKSYDMIYTKIERPAA